MNDSQHQTEQIERLLADQALLNELLTSTSWRITAPARWVGKNLIRRPFHLVQRLTRAAPRRALALTTSIEKLVGQTSKETLPADFNPSNYLRLNPDVAAAKCDPIYHYLHHGRHEGRLFSLPQIPDCACVSDRETILIVAHEASRTGAPILALNLVQAFITNYNVVVLLLGEGALAEEFRLTGATVIEAFDSRHNPIVAHATIDLLCEHFVFKFALINTIESRVVLYPLAKHFIPTLSLIHEFATTYADVFTEALFWSSKVVFSAKVTQENAQNTYPDQSFTSHILPQGRSYLPQKEFDKIYIEQEEKRIRRLMRPATSSENTIVILGAGYIQFRKGVDLFIECANQTLRSPGGEHCRFIWLGGGYGPDNSAPNYPAYLADQIQRAGLDEHIHFIDETSAIEAAYEEADLLLLPSRQDPLPNVAIDAMSHGVPVLCFDKTTGIADFLIDSGLRDHCIAQYLDCSKMAQKILTLANSQELREQIGEQCRKAALTYFDMQKYCTRLEELALTACEEARQEKKDTQTIIDSGLLRCDFAPEPSSSGEPIEVQARRYVRSWASNVCARKPLPGFHPGIYQEKHGLKQCADPFADYLLEGQPDGAWNYPVITGKQKTGLDLPEHARVALHIHVYYPELLPMIMARLTLNQSRPDLFISVTTAEVKAQLVRELKTYKGTIVEIRVVPNCGRDIGPFFTAFGRRIVENYDFVGHIHTKKTVHKDENIGKIWFRFILENLIGGEAGPLADSILAEMKKDSSMGMVIPDDPNASGWGINLSSAKPIATRLGLETLPEQFLFPIGTMFWARTMALAPFFELNLGWSDYPPEPLPDDGSTLHALERLLPFPLAEKGLRLATTNIAGVTR
jgi:glycosyltransferase involved in cell wall biosynthesis